MLCKHCEEYSLVVLLEEFILRNGNYESFQSVIDEYTLLNLDSDNEIIICEDCGKEIDVGEPYIDDFDGFKDSTFTLIAEEMMKSINSCEICGDGGDINGLKPSIKSGYYDKDDDPEEIFSEIDTASDIQSLFDEYLGNESWEEYYEDIAEYMHCPNCPNGTGIDMGEHIDNGNFDLDTSIYTDADINEFDVSFYGDDPQIVQREISEIAKELSLDELELLKNEYIKDKTYISSNPRFAKLHDAILRCFNESHFYSLSENRLIFRTRVNYEGKQFSINEMWAPPYMFVDHGRYNGVGESILYCSNNYKVLNKEVKISENMIYNYALFRINKPMNLLPINAIFGVDYNGLISEEVKDDNKRVVFREQYIISNIVSALARNIGFNGIVYVSTKDKISTNFAFFNYKKYEDISGINTFF
ncbi:hypothetical protein E4V42_07280 [Clostridium estertheticum]|uniref:RES domain-containing protein n=1 Tax=Clostridium estertheticum TaxID=238834 RepID=A0A5N7ILP7_9CLOT|nr:hypothetical protein [Clostridium estertheticum]MPQ31238.1 hypothetical protein [Clostridium estertheticum]MPQ61913.1 hypothetical protein [Clostridium estertheticum]